MKANEIKTPSFKNMTARVIAKMHTITSIADEQAEVIKKILQDELEEECRMLAGYYEEEYRNELGNARIEAYYEGYEDGYEDGKP